MRENSPARQDLGDMYISNMRSPRMRITAHSRSIRWPGLDEFRQTGDVLARYRRRSRQSCGQVTRATAKCRSKSSQADDKARTPTIDTTVLSPPLRPLRTPWSFCDHIMALGFHHAFKPASRSGQDDMVVPARKCKLANTTARPTRSSSSSSTRASSPGRK